MSRRGASSRGLGDDDARKVLILAYPGVDLLDLAGAKEVLAVANLHALWEGKTGQPYRVEVVSPGCGPSVETACGLRLTADRTIGRHVGPVDTLIAPAAHPDSPVFSDERFRGNLVRQAGRARRLVAVCAGALVLAWAGLLEGRRVTTHWRACAALKATHPGVEVDPEPVYVKDGNVYTSAGGTAGIDLILALVEEDLGREAALSVAKDLVLFLRRPGGQSQFSEILSRQAGDNSAIEDLLIWVAEHVGEDLSLESLAKRAHMSLRNFTRVFLREVGLTPARYVERVRVEAVRRRLEETNAGIDTIADQCGYGSADSMRRSFRRILGVGPGEYRQRFRG